MENSEQNTQPTQIVTDNIISNENVSRFLMPLEMRWQPKEDITAYELAKCLPYLLRNSYVMPFEIDTNENHFRHFVINDPNK